MLPYQDCPCTTTKNIYRNTATHAFRYQAPTYYVHQGCQIHPRPWARSKPQGLLLGWNPGVAFRQQHRSNSVQQHGATFLQHQDRGMCPRSQGSGVAWSSGQTAARNWGHAVTAKFSHSSALPPTPGFPQMYAPALHHMNTIPCNHMPPDPHCYTPLAWPTSQSSTSLGSDMDLEACSCMELHLCNYTCPALCCNISSTELMGSAIR